MCYDDQARPPIPPGVAGKAQGNDTVLTSGDGTKFAAYEGTPENPTGARVIIYPDVRGLHQFYKELALRFAEIGTTALAIDYFGRTAGLTSRDDTFEYMPHVQKLTLPGIYSDVTAAMAHLQAESGTQPTFIVGFCMGGTLAFLTGTQQFDLAGVIGFYAGMTRDFGGGGTLLDRAEQIRVPALGLFGGADQAIPVDAVHTFDEKLDKAGIEHEVVIYEGAPHSFFDRKAAEFAAASTDAWERILRFISAHTAIVK